MVLLSEIFQALLGLRLIGCQVHNKALERPILCLHDCAIVQISFFSHRYNCFRSTLDTQSGAGPWQCTAGFQLLRRVFSYRALRMGTLRRSSSFMPGPKLLARWAARARASARATSLAAFAEATSTDCRILHRQRPTVLRNSHHHIVCRQQAEACWCVRRPRLVWPSLLPIDKPDSCLHLVSRTPNRMRQTLSGTCQSRLRPWPAQLPGGLPTLQPASPQTASWPAFWLPRSSQPQPAWLPARCLCAAAWARRHCSRLLACSLSLLQLCRAI